MAGSLAANPEVEPPSVAEARGPEFRLRRGEAAQIGAERIQGQV